MIDAWLMADREAPHKQRHTAKRLHQRLVDEHSAEVAEVTARQCVRARKRQLGWPVGDVFMPQIHAPGKEAEVDRGQAPASGTQGAQKTYPLRNGWQAASRASRAHARLSPRSLAGNSFSMLLDIVGV